MQHRVEYSVIIQILHTRSDHWVIFNIYYSGTELSLYDTACNDIDYSTIALIRSMYVQGRLYCDCSTSTKVAGRCWLWSV